MEIEPGQQVIWNYKSCTTNIYAHKIPAKIIKLSPKQVQIQVKNTTGKIFRRWVHQDRLETFKTDPTKLAL